MFNLCEKGKRVQSTNEETTQVELCNLCGVKVRVHPDKLHSAHCPRCSAPLGDTKVTRACPACQVSNRVLRTRLLRANCGKCRELLSTEADWTRENIIADACGILEETLSIPVLAARMTRPRSLFELIACFEKLPIMIGDAGMLVQFGPERSRLTQLAQKLKGVVDQLRPLCFKDSTVLFHGEDGDRGALVTQYMLQDAFEAARVHGTGWLFLQSLSKSQTTVHDELRFAVDVFAAIIQGLTRDLNLNQVANKPTRSSMSNDVHAAFTHAIEVWLPRPIKLSAVQTIVTSRLKELPYLREIPSLQEPKFKHDVLTYLALTTTVLSRAVSRHKLAATPTDAWQLFRDWFENENLKRAGDVPS
jgi:hypothetical protein